MTDEKWTRQNRNFRIGAGPLLFLYYDSWRASSPCQQRQFTEISIEWTEKLREDRRREIQKPKAKGLDL